MPRYLSTKTFGHEFGLSVAFRQHRAESHCRFLHGYALSVKLTFSTTQRDKCGWVVDFGGFAVFKQFLKDAFDHKLLVASDDPRLDEIGQLRGLGIAEVIVVEETGCEAFAKMIHGYGAAWLRGAEGHRVRLVSVEVAEHGGNSAIYTED